jgi:hypothetical protein
MWKVAPWILLVAAGCVHEPPERPPMPMPPEPPITRDEVERLSRAGITEAVILEQVEKRGARPLNPDDLVALKNAGTSDAVVQKMISSERKEPDVVVVQQPAYLYHNYYYGPYWYGPYWGPYWGFGVSYYGYRGGYYGYRYHW